MKTLFGFLFLVSTTALFGQTDSLEKAAFYNKYQNNRNFEEEFPRIGRLWTQRILSEGYPNQPMDKNGRIHYVFVNEFKGLDKECLVNRTLEWLAVNYGIYTSAGMYSNLKDGRIIYNLSLRLVNNYSCVPTAVISIKDEKIRFEYFNLVYQAYYPGDYDSGTSGGTVNVEVFPVILKKPAEWNLNLAILRETTKVFNAEVKSLSDYILNYEQF